MILSDSSYRVLAAMIAGAGGLASSPDVQAQSAPAAPTAMIAAEAAGAGDEDAGGVGGDAIIVTGTRTTNRTVTESIAPIDVLTRGDLQTSGKQSTRDLLGTLTPSISVSNSGAGASFAVKTLSLRGLAGDQVLVLVNGKRRHNTANIFINGTTQNGQSPPDLDLIPSTAIERIEILRDGASAQYGSDAIAGVINIILRDDARFGASVLGGATAKGDGEQGRFQADGGFALGAGSLHLAADVYSQARTIRGGPFVGRLYFPGDPREATADRDVNKPGQPSVSGASFSYDFKMPLGEGAEVYSFGTYGTRHAQSWLTYRQPSSTNNIVEVYPEGYSPNLHLRDEDFQVGAGIRGEIGGFARYDLSSSYARDKVRFEETTALNASLGPASPTGFYVGSLRSTEWLTNLDLTKEVDFGLVEPLSIAVGAEYREDKFSILAGEPASYIDGGYRSTTGPLANTIRTAGSQGVTGFPLSAAGSWKRSNWSAYINLEQKIVTGVEVALAGRHEDYSDFGTTDTGKASLRIEPISGLAFRGTVSTGFRAPTLQQQHYASSSTIGVLLPGATATILAPVRTLPVDDPAAVAWGSAPLKPETSTNYSAGLVFTMVPRLNVTVDAYQIDIDDRILLSGTLTGAASGAGTYNALGTLLLNAGLNPVQSGFFFSNAASTRTRGLDVVATYRADLGDAGTATLSLSANFNKTKFTRLEVPPQLEAIGVQLIDRARQGDFTKGTPRNKQIANLFWSKGGFSANLRATRYGEVTQVAAARAADGIFHDDTIKPKVILDLELSAEVREGVKLSVGANNLLDTYPTILDPVNQGTTGFALYNAYSPYGISGGFYYGKLSFSF
ncbi:TonB-dependent siderophore receptor [Novosphingobium sp. 9U]|uniref:TonB-dependent receptor plug domain-containing protein n=1 Tax=Novosphingobium sp. 9U TaxID=2653158 RepID=UPI0012F0BF90|nr:TonB-dependent receptor [Novosphingobium sp. 9U]VWX54601.1 Iron complex outermembrane recepter protein [Novosphingobium sp. 9U]